MAGFIQTFEAQVASGASTSSYIDLGNTNFQQMAVRYVTMSTGAELSVYGADANSIASAASATFYPVYVKDTGTAAAAYDALTVTTALSGGNWGTIEAPPHRFIQFVASAVVSGGVSLTVVARGE
jgi:hypothetical protein